MKSLNQPSAAPQRTKKQNHANIPCPIEHCAKFTYGKLPDHLTKRHGLVGKERDAVNERQRKRFFNGELCQVKFLKESAIVDLWGDTYNDPAIKQKIHEGYAMVKIRIIPVSATRNRVMPLTEQDANILTNYNARTIVKPPQPPKDAKRKAAAESSMNKRRRSCDESSSSSSSSGEENNNTHEEPEEEEEDEEEDDDDEQEEEQVTVPKNNNKTRKDTEVIAHYKIVHDKPQEERSAPAATTAAATALIPASDRLQDLLDSKLDEKYKYVINDMKKSMTMGRTLSSKKQRTYRTYKRYAKRLIVYLQKQNPRCADDIDDLLGKQKCVAMFMEAMNNYFKPKTVRNYIIACIKLLDSRLFLIETDPACKDKVAYLTTVYNLMHAYLAECTKHVPKKDRHSKRADDDSYEA